MAEANYEEFTEEEWENFLLRGADESPSMDSEGEEILAGARRRAGKRTRVTSIICCRLEIVAERCIRSHTKFSEEIVALQTELTLFPNIDRQLLAAQEQLANKIIAAQEQLANKIISTLNALLTFYKNNIDIFAEDDDRKTYLSALLVDANLILGLRLIKIRDQMNELLFAYDDYQLRLQLARQREIRESA